MLSIQIDTKSLKLVIYHQFNNTKLSSFASHMKSSFPLCMFNRCCTIIRYSRVYVKKLNKIVETYLSFHSLPYGYSLWDIFSKKGKKKVVLLRLFFKKIMVYCIIDGCLFYCPLLRLFQRGGIREKRKHSDPNIPRSATR